MDAERSATTRDGKSFCYRSLIYTKGHENSSIDFSDVVSRIIVCMDVPRRPTSAFDGGANATAGLRENPRTKSHRAYSGEAEHNRAVQQLSHRRRDPRSLWHGIQSLQQSRNRLHRHEIRVIGHGPAISARREKMVYRALRVPCNKKAQAQ